MNQADVTPLEGHFGEGASWYRYDEPLTTPMGALLGAEPADVALMGTLTSNLHLLLASFFGTSMNMMTMFALIVVLGMVVDGAIIVAENIYRHNTFVECAGSLP